MFGASYLLGGQDKGILTSRVSNGDGEGLRQTLAALTLPIDDTLIPSKHAPTTTWKDKHEEY